MDLIVCTDRMLPPEHQRMACELAVLENPANGWDAGPLDAIHPEELALIVDKKWAPGRTLNVFFLDGDPGLQAKVMAVAKEWEKYANIKLQLARGSSAEIRVSFRQAGSWSFIGTDCLAAPANQPTMNFGWLTPNSPEQEIRRVVLHEFGHGAIAAIHEHQNPTAGIPWNREAVYAYYGGPPNNWTRAQIDTNLFEKYSESQTQFTAWDPHSIMEYPIDARLLTDPSFAVGFNAELSETDKAFAAKSYPWPDAPPPPPPPGSGPDWTGLDLIAGSLADWIATNKPAETPWPQAK